MADAHVAALTHPRPARDYVVGGVNAPQQAIYEFLKDERGRPLPRRLPNGVAVAGGARAGGLVRASSTARRS